MSLGDILIGIIVGSGATWWACRQGLKDAFKRAAVVLPHGKAIDNTYQVMKEASYREPAVVDNGATTVAGRQAVLCNGCKHLEPVWMKCLATPRADPRGPVDQITGETRKPIYEHAVIVNANFDCKKKVPK